MGNYENLVFDLLSRFGELSVEQLSGMMNISPSSVRRALLDLDSSRFVQRTRGGVMLAKVILHDPLPAHRLPVDPVEARAIARGAVGLIDRGDVIGLSGGAICTELALRVRLLAGVTVVTNAVNVAAELAGLPDVRVMVTGGVLEGASFELVGQALRLSLEGIHIHKFFVGTDGITLEHGLSSHSEAGALAARELARHADQTIVLADSSKFRQSNLAQVMPISGISTIITSDLAREDEIRPLQAAGVRLIVAPRPRLPGAGAGVARPEKARQAGSSDEVGAQLKPSTG